MDSLNFLTRTYPSLDAWTLLRGPYLAGPSTLLMGPPYVEPPFQFVFQCGPTYVDPIRAPSYVEPLRGPSYVDLARWTPLQQHTLLAFLIFLAGPPIRGPPYMDPFTWTLPRWTPFLDVPVHCVDPPYSYVDPLTWNLLPVPYLAPYVGLPYIGPPYVDPPYVDPLSIHPHKDNQR